MVKNPVCIKHCLHFFCRECFNEQVLKYKKECPLCKVKVSTKREVRPPERLIRLMQLLNIQEEATLSQEELTKDGMRAHEEKVAKMK